MPIQLGDEIQISDNNGEKLLKHIQQRLEFAGGDFRNSFVDRLEIIDRELSGYIRLNEDDRKRERDNKRGFSPKVTDVNMQLVDTHLDSEITYLLSVLAPEDGIYSAIADKEEQPIANAFAGVLNQHARVFRHYHHMAKAISDMMRYNFGGHIVEWREIIGQRVQNSSDRQTVDIEEDSVIESGNAIDAIDPYNFLWDIAVHPTELSTMGEFFATVQVVRPFTLRRWAANREVFNVEEFLDDNITHSELIYYRQKPDVYIEPSGEFGRATNWTSYLSTGHADKEISDHHEIIDYYGWVNPKDFGIDTSDDSDRMQIWRFRVANNKHIIAGENLNNAHGQLPVAIGMPKIDNLGLQTKSIGESLVPFQRFASHEMNVHQRASRKSLYGLTFYDSRAVPLQEMSKDDLESAKIPVKLTGTDRDIRRAIMQVNDAPQTNNTLANIGAIVDLMDRMLPTNMVSNLTSLDRATQYQAANVVHGSNRRNLKIAKTIHIQCYTSVQHMMMYNTFQFQTSIELIDPNTGEKIQANPAEFRETKVEYSMSDGLKGIDRFMIIESIKEVIGMLIQSNNANGRVDTVAIINYWTSLMGENIDFTQFKITDILDTLSPEERQIAVQLFEQFVQSQQAQQGQATGGAANPLINLGG